MEKKTVDESLAKQKEIKREYETEKEGMVGQINSLKQEQAKLAELNASLQQLFNE